MRLHRAGVGALALLIGGALAASGARAQAVPAPNTPVERNLAGKRQSCTATNEARDQRCGIACQPGQTAACEDGEAADLPTCQCEN